MEKKIHKTLFVLTIILLSFPTFQQYTFDLKSLTGINEKVDVPKLTFENYRSGTFQSQVDKYLDYNFGFREWLVPLYNQYVWDFYGKIEHKDIFFGKENWLYFYEMIKEQYESLTYKYAKSSEVMRDILERDAQNVYRLQELLKDYNTTLFVCIPPGKNDIMPEYLPDKQADFRKDGIHAYDFYVNRFTELGVNFLDLNQLYKSMKGNVSYPLFYKGGSHYSHISATYSADTLVRYMEEISGHNIQDFTFGEPVVHAPKKIDRDMEALFNLMRPLVNETYYYVNIIPTPGSTAEKLRWLTIGDSFYWNISQELRENSIFASTPFWYYNKQIYYDDKSDTDEVDIAEELKKADIVMLLWCPINLYDLDHKFVQKALNAFN